MRTSVFGSEYQTFIDGVYDKIGAVSVVLLIMAVALIGGFGITRICKLLRVPYVTGYIILGILLGPSLLGVIPDYMLTGHDHGVVAFAGLSFVGDITMAFIAFSIGKFFKFSVLKDSLKKVMPFMAITSLIVGLSVGGASYLIYEVIFQQNFGIAPALLLGAVAMAISPTATSSIIRQYKAKGPYVEKIYQSFLWANVISILVFTIVIGIVSSLSNSVVTFYTVFEDALLPLIHNIALCLVAAGLAFVLSLLNNYRRTNDSRIILVIAFIAIITLLSTICKITPLLPAMVFGMCYYNFSKSEALFYQLESFLPPILCLFFVVSGAKLDFRYFSFEYISVVVVAIFFVIVRSGTQHLSTRSFGKLARFDSQTRKYLPLSMMCLTSVAVGLMNLALIVFSNAASEVQTMINYTYTIVLTAAIILELSGPSLGRLALIKTKAVDQATLLPPTDPKKAYYSRPGDN